MCEFLLNHLDNDIILSYLGSKENERLLDDINRLKQRLIENITPRSVTAKFSLEKTVSGINLLRTNLTLTGKDIGKLLEHSDECILMAETLGAEADKLIAYIQKMSISDGVIIDAIASAFIEAVCDGVQSELAAEHSLTRRYSPGYGDLPLKIQPQILSVLNTQKKLDYFAMKAI